MMTVKDLIEKLQQENQNALVYISTDTEDDYAICVRHVSRNVLVGKDETVLIHQGDTISTNTHQCVL